GQTRFSAEEGVALPIGVGYTPKTLMDLERRRSEQLWLMRTQGFLGGPPSPHPHPQGASLHCCAIEGQDNELITLELIHRYVELLDKYFGSVCELDIIFNFEKAYFILDEFLMGGEVQDTSKKSVLKAIEQADLLQEEDESPRSVLEEMGLA
uniref:AP complex mu/sigma subunit domain-containing protein n=1 Tax=Naja naja TaxID=35670 RepID=A0A8C6Y3B0_NAJNA